MPRVPSHDRRGVELFDRAGDERGRGPVGDERQRLRVKSGVTGDGHAALEEGTRIRVAGHGRGYAPAGRSLYDPERPLCRFIGMEHARRSTAAEQDRRNPQRAFGSVRAVVNRG